MKTIYMLRHSITDYNQKNMVFGSLDVPLNEAGIQLVHKRKILYKDSGIQGIVTSDLLRATQTAEIIAEFLEVPVYKTDALRERDQGLYEGMNLDEVYQENRNFNFSTSDNNRESLKAFISRIKLGVQHAINDTSWETFMIISHNGVLKLFMQIYLRERIRRWELCTGRKVYFDDVSRGWYLNDEF